MFRNAVLAVLVPLWILGCTHASDAPQALPSSTSPISLDRTWTASGKLLVQNASARQTLRFSWAHSPKHSDRVTLSDSLALKSLTLYQRDDSLLIENVLGQRVPLNAAQIDSRFQSLLAVPPASFAHALSGHRIESPLFSAQTSEWQRVGDTVAPRVLNITSGTHVVKMVITQWAFNTYE